MAKSLSLNRSIFFCIFPKWQCLALPWHVLQVLVLQLSLCRKPYSKIEIHVRFRQVLESGKCSSYSTKLISCFFVALKLFSSYCYQHEPVYFHSGTLVQVSTMKLSIYLCYPSIYAIHPYVYCTYRREFVATQLYSYNTE